MIDKRAAHEDITEKSIPDRRDSTEAEVNLKYLSKKENGNVTEQWVLRGTKAREVLNEIKNDGALYSMVSVGTSYSTYQSSTVFGNS